MSDEMTVQLSELRVEYARALAHERFQTEGEHRPTYQIAREIEELTPKPQPKQPTGRNGAMSRQAEAERRWPKPKEPDPIAEPDQELTGAERDAAWHKWQQHTSRNTDLRRDLARRKDGWLG